MEYGRLCEAYLAIESTSKRLEKTAIIADLLHSSSNTEQLLHLLQGRVFPLWNKQPIGVSAKLMLRGLSMVSGASTTVLEKEWSTSGDLGLVAQKHVTGKSQQTLFSENLSVEKVYTQLQKISVVEGKRSQDIKLKMINELLSHATPLEARYITRTVLETLRIGISLGTIRDGIIYAYLPDEAGIKNGEILDREQYNFVSALVQCAYDKTNDFSAVAIAAKKGVSALEEVHISLGVPIKVMLGVRGTSLGEAISTLGTPLLLQYKYDGFRVEIHKNKDVVQIFTRRLEDVTEQFPDIERHVLSHVKAESVILDGEAIGVDPESGNYLPFQAVSQRIKRKYGITEIAKSLPVDVRIFDILYKDGKELLSLPLHERHKLLQQVIEEEAYFGIAHTLITSSLEKGQTFYDAALTDHEEGLFAKKLDSVYQPGTRVGNWIKLKSVMEPLDVAIIGAEWGEGKRSGWLTSFIVAVQDNEGELLEIGRVATGLKEIPEEGFSFPEITNLLTPLIEFEDGKYVQVRPKIILEIAYEEIQKSPSYSSGYALRFPRVKRNRTDERGVDDISTIEFVEQLYGQQRS